MPGMIVSVGRIAAAGALMAAAAGCAAASVSPPPAPTHRPASEAAVPAGRLPGLYLGLMAGPWYGPVVRPRTLLLGADWSVGFLRWTQWSRWRADGRGLYGSCQGAGGPCDYFWATIAASHVRVHNGRRYFAVMKITGRHERVEWLVMNATMGSWQQSRGPA